jgi:hypothetical protein
MKVRVKEGMKGYYGDLLRKEDEVFEIEDTPKRLKERRDDSGAEPLVWPEGAPMAFSPRWMEEVPDEEPITRDEEEPKKPYGKGSGKKKKASKKKEQQVI